MSSEEPEWVLYYWGCPPGVKPFPGRGEFVRLIFEEAGVKFREVNDFEVLKKLFFTEKQKGFYAFAPPMIQRGKFRLSQTSVICSYLGKQFGLWPESEEDQWRAQQLNITIHDFIAEGRLAFHGRNPVESYYTQKEETQPYIDRFVATRLPRWLTHLETALKANNDGQGFVIGGKLTYVDLGLLHVLRATESQFPQAWASNDSIPLLKAFKARLSARPNLAAYFNSDRCVPFEGNSMM
ncbi:glutathione S-transferase P-like isoform X2 [Branchiostoma floridae]|nr:glutathione S-transferase P-like isoform X2 [Branchiostoma floridae]XP_035669729.1 glutathione S-transferase P-like isoform X2 [Branchiostoma floridae]